MRKIGEWTIIEDGEGTRRALHAGADGVRLMLTLSKSAGTVAFLRLRCPDAVFERMQSGGALDTAALASVEIEECAGPTPAAVMAALLDV